MEKLQGLLFHAAIYMYTGRPANAQGLTKHFLDHKHKGHALSASKKLKRYVIVRNS